MVFHTIKNIVESIKFNQATVEKLILSQAVEGIIELYVRIPKGTLPEVVQKHIKATYLTHGEDDQ